MSDKEKDKNGTSDKTDSGCLSTFLGILAILLFLFALGVGFTVW